MAKGNLFLGFARGKLGSVVFTRVNGEQISRPRNTSPRNPRTPLQLLQRVVLKTTSSAFALMQEITNHSFQGEEGVTPNQSAFIRMNVQRLRKTLEDVITSGDEQDILDCTTTNFNGKLDTMPAVNPYIVSDGTLGTLDTVWLPLTEGSTSGVLALNDVPYVSGTTTYRDVIDALGCQPGDQITVVYAMVDDMNASNRGWFTGFRYGRFILMPVNGDLTTPIGQTTAWNPRNSNVNVMGGFSDSTSTRLVLKPADAAIGSGRPSTVGAAAYILSRQGQSMWLRSKSALKVRPDTLGGAEWYLRNDVDVLPLYAAVRSFMTDETSTLYLNQSRDSMPAVTPSQSVAGNGNREALSADAGEEPVKKTARK